MQLGMIGLGRMGNGMTKRLEEKGHEVKTYDPKVPSTAKTLGALPQSTIGYERIANWGLAATDEAAFVTEVLTGQPEPPVGESGPAAPA